MADPEQKNAAPYSRSNPSPEYLKLIEQYQILHTQGNTQRAGKDVYPGVNLHPFIGYIKALIDQYGAKTLLDYGAGKGTQYTHIRPKLAKGKIFQTIPSYWNVAVTCFDPGNENFDILPDGPFDAVISTDVLEHCPKDDLDWILDEMFTRADQFVLANIACYPANTILPNGENAHATIENPQWWKGVIETVAARHPDVDYYFVATVKKKTDITLISNKEKPANIPAVSALPKNLIHAYWSLVKQRLKAA